MWARETVPLVRPNLTDRFRIRCVLLITLTLLFGLHILRVYLPTVLWYLGQFLPAEGLALYGLATFALALLAPFTYRWLAPQGARVLTIGGLALIRLAIQLARTPAADLVLATAGLVLLSWFIPQWCQSRHSCPTRSQVPILAVAFPLAFLIDTGSRSLLLSYDLAWRESSAATLGVMALTALSLLLLWRELRECPIHDTGGLAGEEPSLSCVLPLLGLGPWLYVAMTITHNPAVLAAATDWEYGLAHLTMTGFAVLGALAAVLVAGWSALQRWQWALAGGCALIVALAFLVAGVRPGWLWVGLAAVTSWAALGEVLTATARTEPLKSGLWRSTLVTFLTLTILLVIIVVAFGYGVSSMTVVAGAILGLAALWATRVDAGRSRAALWDRVAPVGVGAAGVLLAVMSWALLSEPPRFVEVITSEQPLRVMTFNIHHGIDARFGVDLEAIADVIAGEDPDVVVLNEVNRARLNNGFVDTLLLISRRLEMPYVFGANLQDRQFGNAILSRFPILSWNNTQYAHKTTEIRGLLSATIQVGGNPITVLATHLDHVGGADHVRAEQVAEALAQWEGKERTILLGDLNAEPEAPELAGIYRAGFTDVLAATGQDGVFTFWDPIPSRRIDYIFLTPDLQLRDAWVVPSRASDHLPVLAELTP